MNRLIDVVGVGQGLGSSTMGTGLGGRLGRCRFKKDELQSQMR